MIASREIWARSGVRRPARGQPTTSTHDAPVLPLRVTMWPPGGSMGPPPPALHSRAGTDAGVQSTNDDAQLCKLSCVSSGYYQDPFIRLFVRRAQRKSPLINRGYWARYGAMRQVLHAFLLEAPQHSAAGSLATETTPAGTRPATLASEDDIRCQVVVLGAGFDTTWFQLAALAPPAAAAADAVTAPAAIGGHPAQEEQQQQLPRQAAAPPAHAAAAGAPGCCPLGLPRQRLAAAAPPAPQAAAAAAALTRHTRTIEVDFPEVAAKKARSILSQPDLWQLLPSGTRATAASAPAPAAAPSGGDSPGSKAARQACSRDVWVKAAACPGSRAAQATPAASDDARPGGTHGIDAPAAAAADAAAVPCACPASSGGGSGSSSSSSSAGPDALAQQRVQELVGPRYSLVAADLRQLQGLAAALARGGWDPRLPTLWVSECCLIYLEPQEASALLTWIATSAQGPAAVVVYEQTRPHDAFGRTMLDNLSERGCPLRSIDAVPTPQHQVQRLQQCGWGGAAAADLHRLYHDRQQPGSGSSSGSADEGAAWWLPAWAAERDRVQRLELLDEVEEWKLLQEHYVLVLGACLGPPCCSRPAATEGAVLQPPPPPPCSQLPAGEAQQAVELQPAAPHWLSKALRMQQLARLGAS